MTACRDIFILPSVSEVDFSDAGDITGYAHLLSATAAHSSKEKDPGRSSFMKRQVRSAAMNWLGNVEDCIPSLSAGDALKVTDYYDTIHRLAYDGSPSSDPFVSLYRMKAFEAKIHGDVTVDRYNLQQAITRELDRRTPEFFGRPLRWKSESLDRWHKQFRHGISLTPESDYDTINRVSLLLTSDLWAFETRNESRYKQNLFENHRHYLESIHNATPMHNAQCIMHNKSQNDRSDYELCIMNYELTNALQSFLLASTPYLSPEEYTTYDTQIRAALIASKETNKFLKAALRVERQSR